VNESIISPTKVILWSIVASHTCTFGYYIELLQKRRLKRMLLNQVIN